MFCFVALIVLSIMGIFSASHRALARQAIDCVFRNLTLRPCNTDFKEKVKGKVVGKLLDKSVFAARFFNKYFELISWVFFILMVWSIYSTVVGGYNYYLYGNCNGLNTSGFCVFDPSGANNKVSQSSVQCNPEELTQENVSLNGFNESSFPAKGSSNKNKVIFIGCYSCDYTREVYPSIKKLFEKNDIKLIFAHYPLHTGTEYLSELNYCAYDQDEERFWKLSDELFKTDKENLTNQKYVNAIAKLAGFDMEKMKDCIESVDTRNKVEIEKMEIQKTNFYGTPTIFVNEQAVVGPKPYRVYERMLK